MIQPTTQTVVVPVESGWWSKINWTQAASALSAILVFFFGQTAALTAEQQLAVVVVIGLITNAATFVLRQWFTKTVTPAAISK